MKLTDRIKARQAAQPALADTGVHHAPWYRELLRSLHPSSITSFEASLVANELMRVRVEYAIPPIKGVVL